MNLLAQVVPGLREARTPFAVGVVWVLAAWICLPLVPENVRSNGQVVQVVHELSSLSPELKIGLGAFLIYLLGVLLEALGRASQVVLKIGALLSPALILLLDYRSVLFSAMDVAVLALIVGVVSAFVRTLWRLGKLEGVAFRELFKDALELQWSLVSEVAKAYFSRVRLSWEPEFRIYNELVQVTLDSYLRKDPHFLQEYVAELTASELGRAAQAIGIRADDLIENADDEVRSMIEAEEISILLRFRLQGNGGLGRAVRHAVEARIRDDVEAQLAFANVRFSQEGLRARLRASLERAAVQLRASDHRELYEEYDRLSAEGAFRIGLSVPLAVLAGALVLRAYEAGILLTHDQRDVLFAISASFAVGVVIWITGNAKSKEAKRVLYSAVRLGVVDMKLDDLLHIDIEAKAVLPSEPRISRAVQGFRDVRDAFLMRVFKAAEDALTGRGNKRRPKVVGQIPRQAAESEPEPAENHQDHGPG